MSRPEPAMIEAALAVRCAGLRKRFGAVVAVEAVDLGLETGQLLALLGPSGCGKTTTLRLIAGFERPDAGTIEIGGRMVARPGFSVPPERRRVGIVFQDYALFPHLEVARNVAYGLPRDASRADGVRRALELVGLAGLERRYPHQLSGGQQQRVALARALAPRPALLLLDEPFSNLDAALRARVRAEVRDILVRAGATAIFVTHDQAEALSLADRVAVMWDGRVLQEGSPQEVYRRPATREVAHFVGEMSSLPGEAWPREVGPGRVRCELGELDSLGPAAGVVDVLIRPETLRVRPAPAGTEGNAEVIRVEFYGHDQRLTLRLPSGHTIAAQVGTEIDFRPGQRAQVSVQGAVSTFAPLHATGHSGRGGRQEPGLASTAGSAPVPLSEAGPATMAAASARGPLGRSRR